MSSIVLMELLVKVFEISRRFGKANKSLKVCL